jgi:hypothetical protein
MRRFTTRESIVQSAPKWSDSIKIVVKAAGPMMSGVPRGTTPAVSLRSRWVFWEKSRSAMANTSSTSPPPMRKSSAVMPKSWKILNARPKGTRPKCRAP